MIAAPLAGLGASNPRLRPLAALASAACSGLAQRQAAGTFRSDDQSENGEGGIRTRGRDKPYTAFPRLLDKPLRHLSGVRANIASRPPCCNQNPGFPSGSLKRSLGMASVDLTIPKAFGFEAATHFPLILLSGSLIPIVFYWDRDGFTCSAQNHKFG